MQPSHHMPGQLQGSPALHGRHHRTAPCACRWRRCIPPLRAGWRAAARALSRLETGAQVPSSWDVHGQTCTMQAGGGSVAEFEPPNWAVATALLLPTCAVVEHLIVRPEHACSPGWRGDKASVWAAPRVLHWAQGVPSLLPTSAGGRACRHCCRTRPNHHPPCRTDAAANHGLWRGRHLGRLDAPLPHPLALQAGRVCGRLAMPMNNCPRGVAVVAGKV